MVRSYLTSWSGGYASPPPSGSRDGSDRPQLGRCAPHGSTEAGVSSGSTSQRQRLIKDEGKDGKMAGVAGAGGGGAAPV